MGATGNVGTSVVEALSRDDTVTSIVAVARRTPDWAPPKTEWVAADLARDGVHDQLVTAFRGADAVVQLAWLFQPTHAPAATWQTNVLGSVSVLAAAAEAEVPVLVCASSVGAYSPGPKDTEVDESWPTHGWPEAAYTREKAYVERVLDTFERDHPQMRIVRMRMGFVFKQQSASQQRRLFAGPFLPGRLVRASTVPVVPDLPGLRFQAVHAADAAEAYRLAIDKPVRGAFNIAADPIVDAHLLADCLGARVVSVPLRPVRVAVSALWHAHLVPASPFLFDAVLRLPIMSTERARAELGWTPERTSRDAITAFLTGLRTADGMPTAPLAPSSMRGRLRELATGVGRRP